jgi:CRISPR/Cas system endoribonuclease Cas6 (RAMP superfamily)
MEFLNLNLNRKRVKDIGISCQTYLSFNVRRSLQIPGEVVDLSSNRTSLASDLLANQIIEMNIRIPMTTFDNLTRYLQLKTTISQIISKCFTREDNNSKNCANSPTENLFHVSKQSGVSRLRVRNVNVIYFNCN